MSELRIEQLRKTFGGTVAVDGADLAVAEGELVAVLGPSGCGKTTLLRCVAGFERPDGGSITMAGRRIDHLPPQSRRVGVVPQEGALFPHLSVGRNVGYGLRGSGRAKRVAEVLDLVGLAGYERRMPHELSGGQRQRVALARAMAPRPELILLDEPFSALDAGLRRSLRSEVAAALRADGATAVLVTHDQDEALSLVDRVAVMHAGRIVQFAPPAEVHRFPVDPWTASFVGDAVWLEGEVVAGVASTVVGDVVAEGGPDGPARVMLRPEQLRLGGGEPNATVAAVEYFGHDALVTLEFAGGVRVRSRVLGGAPAAGQSVAVVVDGAARVFAP